MSDVTHYARARTWLDNPDTDIPGAVRAEMNAALAVSTAQRETEKTVARLVTSVEALNYGLRDGLSPPGLMILGDSFINPASVTAIVPDGEHSLVWLGGRTIQSDGTAVETYDWLGL